MPTRTDSALCFVTYDSTNNILRLIPFNDQGNTVLATAYSDGNALTTAAWAQEDAGRGGYGVSDGPYDVLKLTFS